MALKPIITLPDRRLHLKSEPVATVDDEIRALMDDMLETMYDAPGIGLAAIQIGVPKRVIVIDIARREDEGAKPDPLFLANPEILWASEEESSCEEGCLSIPDYREEVFRPAKIKFGYLDRQGKRQEMDAEGLLATCVQHEIDHLNGILFIDHISRLKRDRILKKFTKSAKRVSQEHGAASAPQAE
ncbi:MAG: peptide deformylase [Methylovirgula sp.]